MGIADGFIPEPVALLGLNHLHSFPLMGCDGSDLILSERGEARQLYFYYFIYQGKVLYSGRHSKGYRFTIK